MGQVWTIWEFVSAEGLNVIEEWYQRVLSEESQFTFDSVLKDLSKTKNHLEWTCFRRFMGGKLRPERIWEIGFVGDGRQYRVLGKFGPRRYTIALLVGCFHKQRVYTPPDALDLAYNRSKALSDGRATYHERKIRIDQ